MKRGSLELKILTPEGSLIEADSLESINVPLADDFPIGIRTGHAPLIAETIKGKVIYRGSSQENQIELHAGVLEIRENMVVILTPGKVSSMPREINQPSVTEYERLMNTLAEKLNVDIDQG